jgi:hypothetical protein
MVWNALQPVVDAVGNSGFGAWLGQSTDRVAWLFVLHLVGLTLLLGGTVIVSLRLLGIGLRSQSLPQLARDVAPWRTAGLLISLVSGALIFTGGAVSYFQGFWFRQKMTVLLVALVFNVTLYRRVTRADEGRFGPWLHRLTGALALLLWFGVGIAGRAIGFF